MNSVHLTKSNLELDRAMVKAYMAWKNRHKQVPKPNTKPLKP